ncbi:MULTISPECIES: hypothetical protein [Giesbergeria]|uniref:DUF4157 domain-containing protein n=1 Tax=Giesbergeria sinuosa TaxID=80883 RepID=A0ABV9QG20_9BURK
MPKISGTIGQIGEESKRAVNNIARELGKTPEAIQACLGNIPQCASEIVSAPLVLPVQAYIDGLYRQSEGRTHSFSPEFVALAQQYFSVDLSRITFADDINTGSGMSVSYCDRIFFVRHGNLWQDRSELHHVLHELEHTVQCQNRGKRTYLAEYVLKAGLDVVKKGRFDVHDVHDFEVAAEAKANQVTDILWNKIRSGTVAAPGSPMITPQYQPQPYTPFPSQQNGDVCVTQVNSCKWVGPVGWNCMCASPWGLQSGIIR